MYKSIFKRHELKYLVSAEQREFIESEFARYMLPVEHGESKICNNGESHQKAIPDIELSDVFPELSHIVQCQRFLGE